MTGPGGAESSADAIAKLLQRSGDALAERRCAAISKALTHGQQGVSRQAGPLAATVDNGRTDAHFRALRVRGARRFSLSSNALTRRLARLRSVTMPDFFPYSWPDKNAKPTREAVMPVPMMTVSGSMFLFLLVYWRVILPAQKFRGGFSLARDQPGS